ncbi:hypothetical protein [Alteromonas sp. W364]|uniref:hypothetical protein n=1 Tax=Alteromonas sp. W364 TaxID=3075610 RepID=UPI0028874205|nr:hypothetical protein [Alteromonas sp. W364]MDT0630106.1 hypothetical protein [Alteromonas sp. W364]
MSVIEKLFKWTCRLIGRSYVKESVELVVMLWVVSLVIALLIAVLVLIIWFDIGLSLEYISVIFSGALFFIASVLYFGLVFKLRKLLVSD